MTDVRDPATYKFRLTTHSGVPGVLNSADSSLIVSVPGLQDMTVVPRDADSLAEATKYHFDCGGFDSPATAKQAGEKLRRILRLLTAAFDLPLVVPSDDKQSGDVHDDIKKPFRDAGGELLVGTKGLSVMPEDGITAEFVTSMTANVRISDPKRVLDHIGELWSLDFDFDEVSLQTIELISLSASETSSKTKFLMSYLAAEQLFPPLVRDEASLAIITKLRELVTDSSLQQVEKDSMLGLLSGLRFKSFKTRLNDYVLTVQNPATADGIPLVELVNRCIRLRNRVAHQIDDVDENELRVITKALRHFLLSVLVTRNQVGDLNFYRPADSISLGRTLMKIL